MHDLLGARPPEHRDTLRRADQAVRVVVDDREDADRGARRVGEQGRERGTGSRDDDEDVRRAGEQVGSSGVVVGRPDEGEFPSRAGSMPVGVPAGGAVVATSRLPLRVSTRLGLASRAAAARSEAATSTASSKPSPE